MRPAGTCEWRMAARVHSKVLPHNAFTLGSHAVAGMPHVLRRTVTPMDKSKQAHLIHTTCHVACAAEAPPQCLTQV